MKISKILGIIVLGLLAVGLLYFSKALYYGTMTIHELLSENKKLKEAITNLTAEDQIGYAKVLRQETIDGKLITTIKFVETDRNDKLKKILEKEFTIEGDIIHFDALIIKFGDKMVMDGKAKSLYLWRRVYGEKMSPEKGFAIEDPNAEPARYAELLNALPLKQRELFWTNIWSLATDSEKLKKYDITAIFGNVVYTKLSPNLLYVFKISATSQLYPEILPAM
jgi:translation initiation factor 1 (eIF-1/SUI1)